jgi:hypothetical protein
MLSFSRYCIVFATKENKFVVVCTDRNSDCVVGKYLFYIAQNTTYYPLKFVPYLQNIYMYVRI